MNLTGIDYSTPLPGSAVKAAGISVVFRYVTRPDWPKSLTAAEYSDLVSCGITVLANWETTADMMMSGYAGGLIDAQQARAYATACGIPAWMPIYYSADHESITPAMMLDYMHGVLAGDHAPAGVYGSYAVVKAAIDAGFYGWGTVAWSNGMRDSRAVGWQLGTQSVINGVTVDLNDLNPLLFGGSTMATVPPSIAARWPQLAGEFPANATFDPNNALIWADAGARYSAEQTDAILARVAAIETTLAQILNALQSLSTGSADPASVASAIVSHIHVD